MYRLSFCSMWCWYVTKSTFAARAGNRKRNACEHALIQQNMHVDSIHTLWDGFRKFSVWWRWNRNIQWKWTLTVLGECLFLYLCDKYYTSGCSTYTTHIYTIHHSYYRNIGTYRQIMCQNVVCVVYFITYVCVGKTGTFLSLSLSHLVWLFKTK